MAESGFKPRSVWLEGSEVWALLICVETMGSVSGMWDSYSSPLGCRKGLRLPPTVELAGSPRLGLPVADQRGRLSYVLCRWPLSSSLWSTCFSSHFHEKEDKCPKRAGKPIVALLLPLAPEERRGTDLILFIFSFTKLGCEERLEPSAERLKAAAGRPPGGLVCFCSQSVPRGTQGAVGGSPGGSRQRAKEETSLCHIQAKKHSKWRH